MTDDKPVEQVIPAELGGERLDRVLARLYPDFSRSRLQNWTRAGHVLLDGVIPQIRQKVVVGEVISLQIPVEDVVMDCNPQNLPLDVVVEDESLLVINKPANLVMHPAAGNHDGTVQNALLFHYPELAQVPRAGIVHRLDKDTTGLFVVARTLKSHHSIVEQLQNRTMGREYVALVQGELVAGGTVDEPIARHPRDRKRMAVRDGGKSAITHYRLSQKLPGHTLLSVKLESGRTHQIRVHMAHIKHAILGDRVYGGRQRIPAGLSESLREQIRQFPRQALHAERVRLSHPVTGSEMEWEIPLPDDMRDLIESLQQSQT